MKPRYLGNTNFAKHLPGLSETIRTSSQIFFATADSYDDKKHTIDISFVDPSSGRPKQIQEVPIVAQPAGLSSSNFSYIDNFKDLVWIILSPTGGHMDIPVAIGMIDIRGLSKGQQESANQTPAIAGRLYKF